MKAKIGGIAINGDIKVELARPIPTLAAQTMKALVYEGPGKIEIKEVPLPTITKPTDALIKILKSWRSPPPSRNGHSSIYFCGYKTPISP